MTELVEVFLRRALEPRTAGRGAIAVQRSDPDGVYTVWFRQHRRADGAEVTRPIARLLARDGRMHLFWKRANGRWTAYASAKNQPFVGSLDACVREIDRDRWNCFWG